MLSLLGRRRHVTLSWQNFSSFNHKLCIKQHSISLSNTHHPCINNYSTTKNNNNYYNLSKKNYKFSATSRPFQKIRLFATARKMKYSEEDDSMDLSDDFSVEDSSSFEEEAAAAVSDIALKLYGLYNNLSFMYVCM